METNNKMYQDLFKLYKHAYSKKVVANCQVEFNQMWKDKIKKGKDNLDIEAYQSESARLKEMIHKNKPSSILSFYRLSSVGSSHPHQLQVLCVMVPSEVLSQVSFG